MPFYLTCDATWLRNLRYVSSVFINKIAYNSETVRDRTKVNINHKSEVGNYLSEFAILFDLRRQATWQINRRYVTSGFIIITKIAYNSETVCDRAKVNINHK